MEAVVAIQTVMSVDWRGVFWASLPLALLASVLVALGLPKHNSPRRQSIDGWGILSMAIATTR